MNNPNNSSLINNGLVNGDKVVSLFKTNKAGLEDLIFIETEHKDIIFTNREMNDFWQAEYRKNKLVIEDKNKVENSMNIMDKPNIDKLTRKIIEIAKNVYKTDIFAENVGRNFDTYKDQLRYIINKNNESIAKINDQNLTKKLATYVQNHDSIEPFARVGRRGIILTLKSGYDKYKFFDESDKKDILFDFKKANNRKEKEKLRHISKNLSIRQYVIPPESIMMEFLSKCGLNNGENNSSNIYNTSMKKEDFMKSWEFSLAFGNRMQNYVLLVKNGAKPKTAQPYKRKEAHSAFENISAGLEAYKGKITSAGASVKNSVQSAYSQTASFMKKDAEQTASDFREMGNGAKNIYASLQNSIKSAYSSISGFLKKDVKVPVNKIIKVTATAALAGICFLTTPSLKEEPRPARSEQAKPALQEPANYSIFGLDHQQNPTNHLSEFESVIVSQAPQVRTAQKLKFPEVVAPTQQPPQEYKIPEVVAQVPQVTAPKLVFPDSKTRQINGFKTAKIETLASLSKMYDVSDEEDVFGFKIDVKGDADEVYSFCDSGPIYATPLVSGTADVKMKNCDGKINVIAAKKVNDSETPSISWQASWKYDRKNDAEQKYAKIAKQVQAQLKAFYESEPAAEAKPSSFNSAPNSGIEDKIVSAPESSASDNSLDYFGIGNVKSDIEKLVAYRNMNNKRSIDWIALTSGVSWVKDRETAYGGLKAGVNIGMELNRYDANIAPGEMKDEMVKEYSLNTEQSLDSIAKDICSKYGIKVSASTIRNSARKALGSNVSRKDGSAKSAYLANFSKT